MRHTIGLALVLALIWLTNSGIYTPLTLSLGLISIVIVVWVIRRMDVIDHESVPVHLTRRLPSYYSWLIWQMLLSNIDVVKRIWRGNSAVSPVVEDISTGDISDMSKVIYANSITLTPGTVVIDLQGDRMRVHAISREVMDDLLEGEMGRRIERLDK